MKEPQKPSWDHMDLAWYEKEPKVVKDHGRKKITRLSPRAPWEVIEEKR